jgi:hypothetical protein
MWLLERYEAMKRLELWHDTILLLSGGDVRRHPRPGEKFELSEGAPKAVRRRGVILAVQHMLLALRIFRD